jgi:M6 family metalloprotease-like protein
MKKFLVFFALILMICSGYSMIAPKKHAYPSEFKKLIPRIIEDYGKGNMSQLMGRWARDKWQAKLSKKYTRIYEDTLGLKIPVLCGKFSDATSYIIDAPEQLQQQLFDGPWPTMTMREFYIENSYGQLELTGDTYGWIDVSQPESYYVPDSAAIFIRELLDSADNAIDFAQYDNDGDGYVEGLIVVHSNIGAEYGGNHIWSHRWRLSSAGVGAYLTNDVNSNGIQVKVDDYTIQGSKIFGGGLERIGVFCHEFGHVLGLPDLYDTSYNSEGIGDWGLMGGGSWNTPESPSHFCIWSKEALGWLQTTIVEEDREIVSIPGIEDQSIGYKLWYEGNPSPYTSAYGAHLNLGRQYFLIENRQRIGADRYLHSPGLLIWHIDNTVISGNTDVNHKLVDLEEADGFNELDLNLSTGDEGDPFPGSTLNTVFDFNSNPNSTAYNGNDSKVSVTNILSENQEIIANLGVGIIRYQFVQINFTDQNGDMIFEPGETIELWIEIKNNTATTASNVHFDLNSQSDDLVIQNNSLDLGNIVPAASGSNSGNPFSIEIDPSAVEQTVELELKLTMDGGYKKTQLIDFVIGIPEYLLINKDEGKLSISNLRPWLDENRYPYEISATDTITNRPLKYRFKNRKFIAIVGGNNENALADTALQDSLQDWMSFGKSLFVYTPEAAYSLDSSQFAQDFLHIRYHGQSTTVLLKGESGDPLGFNGGYIFLEDDDRQLVDTVNGSIASVKFVGTNCAGIIRYEDQNENKIVFSSVDFRRIKNNSPINQNMIFSDIMNWFGVPSGLKYAKSQILPNDYFLMQNYPNPFNPNTTIRFYLPSGNMDVKLEIFNNLGENVRNIPLTTKNIGWNSVMWDGRNNSGVSVSSGIYYYILKVEDKKIVRKMILLK